MPLILFEGALAVEGGDSVVRFGVQDQVELRVVVAQQPSLFIGPVVLHVADDAAILCALLQQDPGLHRDLPDGQLGPLDVLDQGLRTLAVKYDRLDRVGDKLNRTRDPDIVIPQDILDEHLVEMPAVHRCILALERRTNRQDRETAQQKRLHTHHLNLAFSHQPSAFSLERPSSTYPTPV